MRPRALAGEAAAIGATPRRSTRDRPEAEREAPPARAPSARGRRARREHAHQERRPRSGWPRDEHLQRAERADEAAALERPEAVAASVLGHRATCPRPADAVLGGSGGGGGWRGVARRRGGVACGDRSSARRGPALRAAGRSRLARRPPDGAPERLGFAVSAFGSARASSRRRSREATVSLRLDPRRTSFRSSAGGGGGDAVRVAIHRLSHVRGRAVDPGGLRGAATSTSAGSRRSPPRSPSSGSAAGARTATRRRGRAAPPGDHPLEHLAAVGGPRPRS